MGSGKVRIKPSRVSTEESGPVGSAGAGCGTLQSQPGNKSSNLVQDKPASMSAGPGKIEVFCVDACLRLLPLLDGFLWDASGRPLECSIQMDFDASSPLGEYLSGESVVEAAQEESSGTDTVTEYAPDEFASEVSTPIGPMQQHTETRPIEYAQPALFRSAKVRTSVQVFHRGLG